MLYLASRTATVGSEMQPIFERATLKVTKNPHSIGIMPRKIYFCAYKAHFRSGYATQHQVIICTSNDVSRVSGNTDIDYGGGGSGPARARQHSGIDWDDEW